MKRKIASLYSLMGVKTNHYGAQYYENIASLDSRLERKIALLDSLMGAKTNHYRAQHYCLPRLPDDH